MAVHRAWKWIIILTSSTEVEGTLVSASVVPYNMETRDQACVIYLLAAKTTGLKVISLTTLTFRQDLDSYCDGLLQLLDNEVSCWKWYSCMHA